MFLYLKSYLIQKLILRCTRQFLPNFKFQGRYLRHRTNGTMEEGQLCVEQLLYIVHEINSYTTDVRTTSGVFTNVTVQ